MSARAKLLAEAEKRILVTDGAFGTEIQNCGLDEAAYAGSLGLGHDQKGNNDILALTMPIVILVSAATAGIIYVSLGQVLEASARDIAAGEAAELRDDLTLHPVDDVLVAHEGTIGKRVSQIVDDTGTLVACAATKRCCG